MLRCIASCSLVLIAVGCSVDKTLDETPVKILGVYSTDADKDCQTNIIDLKKDSVTIFVDGEQVVQVDTEYSQPFETAQGGVTLVTQGSLNVEGQQAFLIAAFQSDSLPIRHDSELAYAIFLSETQVFDKASYNNLKAETKPESLGFLTPCN